MTEKTLKLTCMSSPLEDPHFGPTTCISPLKEPTFKSGNVQISKRRVIIHTSSGVGCHTHHQHWVPSSGSYHAQCIWVPPYTCMNWSYPHKSQDRKTPHWFLHINQITSNSLSFYLLISGNFLCSFWFFFSL